MTKQKILILLPLLVIGGLIIYSWIIILFTNVMATWQHWTALLLFIVIAFLFFKNFKWAVLATGVYLILGTINLLSLTPSVITNTYGIKIGSVEIWTPSLQLLSFGLLVLFAILNFDTLTDMYFDFTEKKK